MTRTSLHSLTLAVLAALAVLAGSMLYACDKPKPAEPEPEPAPAAQPSDPHTAHAPATAAEPLAEMPEPPAGARVFFVAPAEGASIVSPIENGKIAVAVKMGAEGIAIEPAGPVKAGSGHHHVLIDKAALPKGTVVPKDEQHLHYGLAQTEASLALTPGKHTLTLQLADGLHRSYGEALSATITVTAIGTGTVAAQGPTEQPAPAAK